VNERRGRFVAVFLTYVYVTGRPVNHPVPKKTMGPQKLLQINASEVVYYFCRSFYEQHERKLYRVCCIWLVCMNVLYPVTLIPTDLG
jgi:hypothetical protein